MTESRTIHFPTPHKVGIIVNRPNRFILEVEVEGKLEKCHCPTTGKIAGGMALAGLPCLVSGPYDLTKRTTAYTVEAISPLHLGEVGQQWVGINQTAINRQVGEALEKGWLAPMVPEALPGSIKREQRLGSSRIDFLIGDSTWLEVKMPITYIDSPGAPAALTSKKTPKPMGVSRMEKQMGDLTAALLEGKRAIILATYGYTMPHGLAPQATRGSNFKPLPALARALEAGLERWQLNWSYHPDRMEMVDLFRPDSRTPKDEEQING